MEIRTVKPEDLEQLEQLFQTVRQQIFTWTNPEEFKAGN